MLEYAALVFWIIFILPFFLRLKWKKLIGLGDFLTLTALFLIGSEFLWIYLLYNYIKVE